MIQDQPPLTNEDEYVSYDVESLFTNVPIKATIDYILDEIYVHNKLPIICTRLIMERLLLKLSTESTFIFQSNYYKQIDGCTMGGPLSVTFANIYLTKLEREIVVPSKPRFYKRYVDDVIVRRKIGVTDNLFLSINKYHPKIKFTIEIQPTKFLDTNINVTVNEKVTTSVHRKANKFPTHWSSKVPKRYKRNAINSDLNRSYRIGMHFESEKQIIREKFSNAGFPIRFTDSVITQFEDKQNDDGLIIPEFLFKEPKKFVLIEIPFCESNESLSKRFLEKLRKYTSDKIEFAIKWSTKKVKQLFPVKDKNPHPACKIYQGVCTCGQNYIGETQRNVETRWAEHENTKKNSEPAKHLKKFPNHHFTWTIFSNAPENKPLRKNLEASIIALMRPSLNDQSDSKRLILFKNGVT